MTYSTDKGREQIAAQRRVAAKRKQRKLELAAPKLLRAVKLAYEILLLRGENPAASCCKEAIEEAGQ